jgi:uncharacterized membrane protein YdbT with pleckstrin-like domain
MSYVDENLLSGERVVYRAHLHRMTYIAPAVMAALGLILLLFALYTGGDLAWVWGSIGGIVLLIAGIVMLVNWIKAWSSEFAVTNRRVLIKVGLVRRHTLELLLQKVEGVGVDQTIFGRIFDFGSITVTGTGGTQEKFLSIADPLEFRRQVQSQTAGDSPVAEPAAAIAGGGPYCVACGAQNPGHARFCLACGQKLASS